MSNRREFLFIPGYGYADPAVSESAMIRANIITVFNSITVQRIPKLLKNLIGRSESPTQATPPEPGTTKWRYEDGTVILVREEDRSVSELSSWEFYLHQYGFDLD